MFFCHRRPTSPSSFNQIHLFSPHHHTIRKKLRVAIIGQGRSGRDIHGSYFLSEKNRSYEVVAVVELIEERRERARKEYGDSCEILSDYKALYAARTLTSSSTPPSPISTIL